MDNAAFDRDAYASRSLQFRAKGEAALRAAGIEIYEILVRELAAPGSDGRNGISLVARPTPPVAAHILRIQQRLQQLEPRQYYYPAADLHLTVLEVAFGRTRGEVAALLAQLAPLLPAVLRGFRAPVLQPLLLGFDPKGCALNFVPQNEDFHQLREQLRAALEGVGIVPQARYGPVSAHVSLFRYICPLSTEKERWADLLRDTPVEPDACWKITSLEMTCGANWYGKTGFFPASRAEQDFRDSGISR
jgi:2'-5' RNA ligase